MTLPEGFLLVPERPFDPDAIEQLLDRAFGPGRRARRSYSFREGIASDPALRFVALDPAGVLVGTLRFWPLVLLAPPAPSRRALLLGPLAVEPALNGRGVGRALVRHGLEAARATGHALVLLVGDPSYYAQFGFEPAAPLGFGMPGEDPARLQVLALAPGGHGGGGMVARADVPAPA